MKIRVREGFKGGYEVLVRAKYENQGTVNHNPHNCCEGQYLPKITRKIKKLDTYMAPRAIHLGGASAKVKLGHEHWMLGPITLLIFFGIFKIKFFSNPCGPRIFCRLRDDLGQPQQQHIGAAAPSRQLQPMGRVATRQLNALPEARGYGSELVYGV